MDWQTDNRNYLKLHHLSFIPRPIFPFSFVKIITYTFFQSWIKTQKWFITWYVALLLLEQKLLTSCGTVGHHFAWQSLYEFYWLPSLTYRYHLSHLNPTMSYFTVLKLKKNILKYAPINQWTHLWHIVFQKSRIRFKVFMSFCVHKFHDLHSDCFLGVFH